MNKKQIQRAQELKQAKMDSGLLSEKFPSVEGIVIDMVYYHKMRKSAPDTVLMDRKLNIFPESHAYFFMPCKTKECEGGFDLSPVIEKLVEGDRKTTSGKLVCSHREHASIDYSVTVTYNGK